MDNANGCSSGAILLYAICFSVHTQGSADAFGRLSKVRSELKDLLWTHPSGSQAGIADALEYLNQVHPNPMTPNPSPYSSLAKCVDQIQQNMYMWVIIVLSMQLLHDNYGITLEGGQPDDLEPSLQQPCVLAKAKNAQLALAAPAESMHHQATQTDPSSATLSQIAGSAGETSAHMHSGSGVHDQPAIPARVGPGEVDRQHGFPASGDSPIEKEAGALNKGLEAPKLLATLPTAVPAKAALHEDDTQQAQQPASAVLLPQVDSASAQPVHKKAEAFPAAEVPDSLHLDTSTLQELTALPSAHGRIPISLKSPLPMAAARPAKGRGTGRLPSALTRITRTAKRSPAREAARTTSRQLPLGRAPGMGSQAAGSQNATGLCRLAHPATRKQLNFDDANRHAPGRGTLAQKEAPEGLQGSQGSFGLVWTSPELPSQQAQPHSERGPHQRAAEAHRLRASSAKVPRSLHGAASSDSDTPRSAAACLPQPVQQAGGVNPLFDPRNGSDGPNAAGLHSAQPRGVLPQTALEAAQGAGVTHASSADQATALARANAAGPPQQAQQGSASSMHVSTHTADKLVHRIMPQCLRSCMRTG